MTDVNPLNSESVEQPTHFFQPTDFTVAFTTTQVNLLFYVDIFNVNLMIEKLTYPTFIQVFATRDDLLFWVREVGRQNNIVILITRSDTNTRKKGRSDKLILGCERGGKFNSASSSGSSKASGPHKCDCPFKLRRRSLSTGEGWILKVICGTQNHRLPRVMTGHSFMGRLTKDEKKIVREMTTNNVKPRSILGVSQKCNPCSATTIEHIYNERFLFRSTKRGPRTEMQHLLNLIQRDRYVFWYRRHGDSDIVKDIFWAHPDSINLLNTFHTVLVMDNTYKTNRYRLPLLEVVGVTSTAITYTVEFSYLDHEQQDNFI